MRSGSSPRQEQVRQTRQSEGEVESGTALSLGDVFQMLRRHILFIIASLFICIAASLVVIHKTEPIYQATASIRIDPGRAGSLGLGDLASPTFGENGDQVTTEIAILKSDAVAIDTLYSMTNDEFFQYTGKQKKDLVITPGSTSLTLAQEALLGKLKEALSAKQIEGTQLVAVSVRDPDPRAAARLANRVIQAYLRQTFDSRYGSVNQVTQWLSDQMDTLRDRAERSQRDLAAFQEKNDILTTDAGPTTSNSATGSNTTIDRLRLLNTSLAQAQAERIVKEAQLRAANTGNPAVILSMFPSADLTSLQNEQGRLYALYAQLSVKFDKNYPPLVEVQKDIAKVDSQIEGHGATVRGRLQQEYDAALASEKLLQQQYDEQAEKAFVLNRQQAQYAVLRAEVSASRDLFNTLQVKLQQAGVDAGLAAVNTMLVDTARTPLVPILPQKQTILGFGVILGLFIGIGLAFLIEALSDRIQNIDQLERTLGLPLLTLVPHFQADPARDAGDPKLNGAGTRIPAMLATFTSPQSRAAEPFRTLRSSVLLSSIDKPLKTILVTSALPGEGKSTSASNYAVVLAQNGARVLLIDADLRRPTLPTKFGLPIPPMGLSNLILGEVEVPPYIQPIPELPGLKLLPAGKKVLLPSEMLGSAKFHTLLEEWEGEFDFVIIDSAPLLIVSDSLPLSSWVDAMVLVARYNVTPLKALRRVRDVLSRTNANVVGFVMNDMSSTGTDYGSYKYGYGYYSN